MAIKIIREPDVHITQEEETRYRYEYQHAFMFFAGPVPSFEEYVRRRKASEGIEDFR